jgi:hypothetical protein
VAVKAAAAGERIGFFAPDYKIAAPFYEACKRALRPVIASASGNQMLIETVSGGCVECWTLNNPDAGRSRLSQGPDRRMCIRAAGHDGDF